MYTLQLNNKKNAGKIILKSKWSFCTKWAMWLMNGNVGGRRRKERKRQSWRQAIGESPQRPQSHPVHCTFPWPVSKSTLQAFSILAPYFSVLLSYRFIVQQPFFWRSLNLTHPPPPPFHLPIASRSFSRSHLWSTRNDARSRAKPNPKL